VPPIIRSPPIVFDCDDVYSLFFERKKKLVRKFLYSAGPNIWRNLSKPSWGFMDLLDASGGRFRKAFRGNLESVYRVLAPSLLSGANSPVPERPLYSLVPALR
jgi:hypothetical protein